MTTARCPSCAAAVPVGAPWCTLCFADMRPRETVGAAIAAASGPAPAAADTPAAGSPAAPPPTASAVTPAPLPPHPILDAPVRRGPPLVGSPAASPGEPSPDQPSPDQPSPDQPSPGAPVPPAVAIPVSGAVPTAAPAHSGPAWPCGTCGEPVAFELSMCPGCGSPFLALDAATRSLRLPLVGDVRAMSKGEKVMVSVGGATVVTALLVVVAIVIGMLI